MSYWFTTLPETSWKFEYMKQALSSEVLQKSFDWYQDFFRFFISEIMMDSTSEDLPPLYLIYQKEVANKWERPKGDQEYFEQKGKRARDNGGICKAKEDFPYPTHCLFCNEE